ncbi:MAG: DUF2974 domain-containing protein, partial [Gammaproteobacteria bacterium]|nr:DUF2974 domain-containing protein [Gammaproteobacteria bacterium]
MACSEFSVLNVNTYAALAGDVYNDAGAPEGWTRLEMPGGLTANSENGFYAAAYKNDESGEIVVAYRGTDELQDAIPDVQFGSGVKPNQYDNARAFYDAVKQQSGGASISLTGHSLGGGLAQLVAASTHNDDRVSATAFNAPGVSGSLDNIEGAPDDGDYSYVHNYNAAFDPVSNLTDVWLDQLGSHETVTVSTSLGDVFAQVPDWFAIFAKRNPGAYAAALTGGYLIDQHSMDSMIAALPPGPMTCEEEYTAPPAVAPQPTGAELSWEEYVNARTNPFGILAQDNIIHGTSENNIITDALSGNDTVYGGDGGDFIWGDLLYTSMQPGADTLYGEAGDDVLDGGQGNDFLDGGTQNDLIYGDAGDDVIFGGAGDDIAQGDAGKDFISMGDDNDVAQGGKGNDYLDGG